MVDTFTDAEGTTPEGDLTVIGNTFYGTLSNGGAYDDYGSVFSAVVPAPEPGSAGLPLTGGLLAVAARRRARRYSKRSFLHVEWGRGFPGAELAAGEVGRGRR